MNDCNLHVHRYLYMCDHLIRCRKKHLKNISANKKQETSLTLMRKGWMLYIRKKAKMSTLIISIQHCTGDSIQCNRQQQEYVYICVCVCVCVCVSHSVMSNSLLPNALKPIRDKKSMSMEVSRQEYWTGLPCPAMPRSSQPRDQSWVSMSPALAGGFLPLVPPRKPIWEWGLGIFF